jgi:peptide/nickel transport system substrate-binding protein
MKRIFALGLCLLALACGKKARDYSNVPDKDVVADGGSILFASGGEASKLNPVLFSDQESGDICDMVFNGLLRYSPELKLEGDLATSWVYSDAGKTLTFKLRPGITWHDGKPFESQDVAFTWKAIMDPKSASPRSSDFELVSAVETPDPLTVVVRYKKAFAPALNSWIIGIAPKHLLEGEKDINASAFNRHPVGTGPYIFKNWVDKQFMELEANPAYYEGKPHIARVIKRFIPEQSTQLLELKSGKIDSMGSLTPDQYVTEASKEDFKKMARSFRSPGLANYTYLGFNLKRPPFNDKLVRLAISHAIDRKELISGVLQGLGQPCSGPYSPMMPAYNPKVLPVAYDLKKSAELLEQAGWKKGPDGIRLKAGKRFSFKLITNQGNETRKKLVLIIQQQLAKVGIEAKVEFYEWSTYLSNYVDIHNFDAMVMAWNTGLEPDQYAMWHSSQNGKGQFNLVDYANPEVDRLLVQGRETMDPARRIAIYRRFHELIAADQPYCFLYSGDSLSAMSHRIQGIKEEKTGYSWYWANRWYIPASLQR